MVKTAGIILWVVLLSAHASELPDPQTGTREKIALLPFEQKGLSQEETALLPKRFGELLQSTGTFEVMRQDEMLRLFAEADFKDLETCTYSYCLADAGKILGVQKVMHGSITRRGNLYSLRLRMVDVRNAEIVLDRKSEFSGNFDRMVSSLLPGEAKAAGEYESESGSQWYIVTAAVLVTVAAIYWIYKSFDKTGSSESTGGGDATPQ
jgi:TolB-like protein